MIDVELLHAYVDGELTADERAQVEAAVRTQPSLALQIDAIRRQKELLGRLPEVDCADSWAACRARFTEIDKTKRIEGFVGRYAWAMCAFVLCTIFVGAMLRRANPNAVRTGQVAAAVSGLSFPFPSADSKRALANSQVPEERNVATLGQIAIVGMAELESDGKLMRCVKLRDAVGTFDFVIVYGAAKIEAENTAEDGYLRGQANSQNCIAWWREGAAFFLMAPNRTHEELIAIAGMIH